MCYVQWTKSSGLAYGRKTVQTCSQAQVRNKSLDLVAGSGFMLDQLANQHSDTLRDLAPLPWRGLTEYRWKYSV